MEFKVNTQLSEQLKKIPILQNFDELNTQLDQSLEKYKSVIVSKDDIPFAKKDRKMLRDLRDSINAERLRIKKIYMNPFSEFESCCKTLVEKCNEPIDSIDGQIKAFEEKDKAEKKIKLEQFFNENIGLASEYVTFDNVFNARWLNISTSLKSAEDQILEMVGLYKKDVESLNEMCSISSPAVAAALKQEYRRSLSIYSVTMLLTKMEKAEKEEQQRQEERRKAAELRAQLEREAMEREKEKEQSTTPPDVYCAPAPIPEPVSAPVAAPTEANEEEPDPLEQDEEQPVYKIKLEILGTENQLKSLKTFLQRNGLSFKTIKNN